MSNQTNIDKMYIDMLKKIININNLNIDEVILSIKKNLNIIIDKISELESQTFDLKKDKLTYEDMLRYLEELKINKFFKK